MKTTDRPSPESSGRMLPPSAFSRTTGVAAEAVDAGPGPAISTSWRCTGQSVRRQSGHGRAVAPR